MNSKANRLRRLCRLAKPALVRLVIIRDEIEVIERRYGGAHSPSLSGIGNSSPLANSRDRIAIKRLEAIEICEEKKRVCEAYLEELDRTLSSIGDVSARHAAFLNLGAMFSAEEIEITRDKDRFSLSRKICSSIDIWVSEERIERLERMEKKLRLEEIKNPKEIDDW